MHCVDHEARHDQPPRVRNARRVVIVVDMGRRRNGSVLERLELERLVICHGCRFRVGEERRRDGMEGGERRGASRGCGDGGGEGVGDEGGGTEGGGGDGGSDGRGRCSP